MAGHGQLEGDVSVGMGRITEAEFKLFQALVRDCTGIAIGDTKREMVCARLGKRLRHYGYGTFRQYHEHLCERDPAGAELQALINAITTNKTEFFREAHHFEFLRSHVADERRARAAGPGEPVHRLRVWSAGCSSGEEAYSIAATLLAVALPALELLEEFGAVSDALDGDRRFGWDLQDVAGFVGLPAVGEGFDVGDEVDAGLFGQRIPVGHVGVGEAAGDRVVEILVSREGAGWCGAALEYCRRKVARLRLDPLRVLSVAVTVRPMAANAPALIVLLASGSMAG